MIPKVLHLTCKSKTINNPRWQSCLDKFREFYTDYEIRIYDNEDIYSLIGTHYPDALEKVKQITVGAVLADIFRYLILYLEGGIYADMDCEPLRPIGELFTGIHYHGDPERANHLYVYPTGTPLGDRRWDFYVNPCTNSRAIQASHPYIKTYQCKGHKVGDRRVILCYEFHKDWHPVLPEQVCQWFMIAAPGQQVFKTMVEQCLAKLDILVGLERGVGAYEQTILNTTGPAAFTNVVKADGTCCILPSDFFCAGSWGAVPQTRNSYLQHHFTGTWK